MAEGSARLLSAEENSKFDDTVHNGTGPALILTEAEETLWLHQQQDPDAVLKHLVGFRLRGDPNLPRLAAALHATFTSLPALNVRYRFSPDGELEKLAGSNPADCLRIERVNGEAQAIERLLAEQATAWDLEKEAPIRALLLLGPDSLVLGFVVHRILGGVIAWKPLLETLSRAYRGERPPTVEPADADIRREVDQEIGLAPPEHEAPLAAWLLRGAGASVRDFSKARLLDQSLEPRLAARFGTVIKQVSFMALTGPHPTPQGLLAATALQAGTFLAGLGGIRAIDVSLPRRPSAGFADLTLPFCSERFLRVTMPAEMADKAKALAEIDACLARQEAGRLDLRPRAEQDEAPRPLLYLIWLSDAAEALPLEGVLVERLPLPTLAPRPDFALGLGRHGEEGSLALELLTGQAVSPTAGAFLLERLAGMFAGEGAALPATWSEDLVALRGPEAAAPPAASPATGHGKDRVAQLILAEFRQALAAPEMTADDDFFDHGGHSLIATRVIGRLLSTHGVEVHFNDLFRHPTAAGLARHAVRHGETAEVAAVPAGGTSLVAPLSLAQASLWKIYAAFGFGEIFNLPFALRFLDRVDEDIFARAFQDLLERHSGLRTLFRQEEDGSVRQHVVPPEELGAYRWFWPSRESDIADRGREAGYRFDLAGELPLRLRFMIEPESGRQVLSLLFHHMALDEWSVNLMMDDLDHAYRQRAAGKMPVWPEQPAPFHEFALLQHRAGLNQAHLRYWTDRLRHTPRNQQILPRPIAADSAAKPASNAGGWVELTFESAVTEGLYALAKQSGASLFNVVYAAIAGSLHLLGCLDELVVGTSASGRNEPEFFDTIGYFTTVVAHRVGFSPDDTVAGLIEQVKNTINGSLPNTDIPIDLVEEALGISREREHLFEVFIQLHAKNKFNGAFTLEDGRQIAFRQVDPDRHESVLGLQFEVMEEKRDGERCIRVMMTYRSEHYDDEQVELLRRTTMAVFRHFAQPGGAATRLAELKPAIAATP